MLVLVLSLLVCISSVSAVNLTCSASNFTCPGSVVKCECQAEISLEWRVMTTSQMTAEDLLSVMYTNDRGVMTSMNGYTVVLCSVDTNNFIFTSKLNFTFTENVSVTCQGISTATATLQTAGE